MAITATTSVLTGNDWQYAKDIRPGDWIFNRLGKPVKVKTAQTYRSEECYRVTFDDYLIVEGDNHLAFPTEDNHYRIRSYYYQGKKRRRSQLKVRTCLDLLEAGLKFRGSRYQFSVPTTEPVQLPEQPLGIPPFVFGFWFFSCNSLPYFKVPHEFAEETYEKFKNSGYKVEKLGTHAKIYQKFKVTPSVRSQLVGNMPNTIPKSYMYGSAEQRLELLQGILCTKPVKKATKTGLFVIHTGKKRISMIFRFLCESLGAKIMINHKKTESKDALVIKRNRPFLEHMAESKTYPHLSRRYVRNIEKIPAQLCVHIETDDEDGSFLAGEGFISCL